MYSRGELFMRSPEGYFVVYFPSGAATWDINIKITLESQLPDNCDANTWQAISNSLDIDFIHGDIHGRSC